MVTVQYDTLYHVYLPILSASSEARTMDKCCKAKGNVNGNEFSSSEMDESWKENQNDDYDCPFVITKVESLADFSKCEQSTPTLKDDILQGLHGQDVGISVSPSPLSAHDFQMCTTTPSRREGVRLVRQDFLFLS